MFSCRSLTVSGLGFTFLIHFELTVVSGVRWGVQLHFSACGYPLFSAPFVEGTTLSPINVLGSLLEY